MACTPFTPQPGVFQDAPFGWASAGANFGPYTATAAPVPNAMNPTGYDFTINGPSGRHTLPTLSAPAITLLPGIQTLPDASAFLIYLVDENPQYWGVTVYRSDTLQRLCEVTFPFSVLAGEVWQAQVTAARHILISVEPNHFPVLADCPLPVADLVVSPVQPFADAVLGGAATLRTTSGTFQVKNTGQDCVHIQAIGSAPPFTVQGFSPVDLGPQQAIPLTVQFAPTAIGPAGGTIPITATLPITATMHNGDSAIHCSALARNAVPAIGISSTAVAFGLVPVGTAAPPINLVISNAGETDLTISTGGPTNASSGFTWRNVTAQKIGFKSGATIPININFSPPHEGVFQDAIRISDSVSGTLQPISIAGIGCIPHPALAAPPGNVVDYGKVEQGFRAVHLFTVKNTGSAALTFDAEIQGLGGLFGIQLSPDITDVSTMPPQFVVDPHVPCGANLQAGLGETTLAVVCYANHAPGMISAQLVLKNFNDPAAPVSLSYPLQAEIVPAMVVDACLVIDRSGSMAEPAGDRSSKSDAVITAGQLFARLLPPDAQNRFALVRFNQLPDLVDPIADVLSSNQDATVASINAGTLTPAGATAIAGGVLVGLDQVHSLRPAGAPAPDRLLVALTDGKDNTAYQWPQDSHWYTLNGGSAPKPDFSDIVDTASMPVPTDVRIYGVAIGREENVEKAGLDRISQATGAYYGCVGSDLSGRAYFDLEKFFTQIYMSASSTAVIADPVYTIWPGDTHSIDFDLVRGDRRGLVVIYDRGGRLPFRVLTPKGETIEPGRVPPGFRLRYGATGNARFVEFLVPELEPNRYAGRWSVEIEHRGQLCFGSPVPATPVSPRLSARLISTWGFVPRECRPSDEPIDYGIAIGAGTNVTMEPSLEPALVRIGDTIAIDAIVKEATLTLTDCTLNVTVTAPSGRTWTLGLDPTGHAYHADFTSTAEGGSYTFQFSASGSTGRGEPFSRSAVLGKYVEGRLIVPRPTSAPHPGEFDRCCDRLIDRLDRLVEIAQASRPSNY